LLEYLAAGNAWRCNQSAKILVGANLSCRGKEMFDGLVDVRHRRIIAPPAANSATVAANLGSLPQKSRAALTSVEESALCRAAHSSAMSICSGKPFALITAGLDQAEQQLTAVDQNDGTPHPKRTFSQNRSMDILS